MAQPIRAIVYGVGVMGAMMARLMIEKGVEIVGAIARSPDKVGRDLGDVAKLGFHTGVTIESDPEPALKRGADIAVVCVASYLNVMYEHFRICLEHEVNVITIEEESIWPWNTAPKLAGELDALAKAHGVSLAASGAQDVFWMKLVSTLMGAAHRIDSVNGRCIWNADDYGPEVAAHVHLGETPEQFAAYLEKYGWPEFVARPNLEVLIADSRLTVAEVTSTVEPVLATRDTPSSCVGTILAGRLLGVVDSTRVETVEGPIFNFSMAGRVHGPGESDTNEWTIRGEPDLHLRNDIVPYRTVTCTTVVNRIPDIIAAPAGLITLDQLPQPRYRHERLRE
ncbi:MAG: hypothetical protein ACI9W2_003683 [Gammaproteobacteria bacterium]|jgi:hypothetical protein